MPQASLGPLAAAQPAGEVVHKGGRRVLHCRQIDVARRFATRALDLQLGKAAVHSLVDRGRRINRLAVAPHSLVPAFAQQPLACCSMVLAFARISADSVRRRDAASFRVLAQLF